MIVTVELGVAGNNGIGDNVGAGPAAVPFYSNATKTTAVLKHHRLPMYDVRTPGLHPCVHHRIGPLTSIAIRLTLPKFHSATFFWKLNLLQLLVSLLCANVVSDK